MRARVSHSTVEPLPWTHYWRNDRDDYLVKSELLVLLRELAQQPVEVVLIPSEDRLGRDNLVLTLQRAQQLQRLALLLPHPLNALHDLLQPLNLALLRLDELANTRLFFREICPALLDACTFASEGSERGGECRAEQGQVVAEFGKASRVGGGSAKGGKRRERLIRELWRR